MFLFPLVGFNRNLSLLEIFLLFPGVLTKWKVAASCFDMDQNPSFPFYRSKAAYLLSQASKSTDSAIFEMSPLDDSLSEDFAGERSR